MLDNALAEYNDVLAHLEAAMRPSNKDKIANNVEKEKQDLDRLKEFAVKGDARGLEEVLKHLEEENDSLAQKARAEAAKEKDPASKKMLQVNTFRSIKGKNSSCLHYLFILILHRMLLMTWRSYCWLSRTQQGWLPGILRIRNLKVPLFLSWLSHGLHSHKITNR